MSSSSGTWIAHTTCVFRFWRNEQGMQPFLFKYCWTSKSKISAWIKARLNFALIWSMLLYLQGTKIPSNIDNISKIDLCAIFAESNTEWITYRFIPCYFTIINVYGYILICCLFRYFLHLYLVIRWYGTHILQE